MDDRGRLAQPLKGVARLRSRVATAARPARAETDVGDAAMRPKSRFAYAIDRWSWLLDARLPRGIGLAATAVVLLASLAYGAVKGEHVPTVITAIKDARDGAANAAGFRIVSIALARNHHVSRDE